MYRGASKRDVAREVGARGQHESKQQIDLLADSMSSPSRHAAANEERGRLEQALKALMPRYEQVIRLRNELKLSFNEVGVALNCSADAAQKCWSRAVQQLANHLRADEQR
jgi:RNA polymerase sigma factor (sigma-70 family)